MAFPIAIQAYIHTYIHTPVAFHLKSKVPKSYTVRLSILVYGSFFISLKQVSTFFLEAVASLKAAILPYIVQNLVKRK